MLKKVMITAAAVGICATSMADEVWSTDVGDVVYEKDIGDVAVLSYPTDPESGQRGHVFIKGLGGNYDDRGHFTGYWSEPETGGEGCSMSIVDGNGLTTNNWGRVTMTFLDTGFPSSWVAVRGTCFEEPNSHLVGNPVVAPSAR